MQQTYGGVARIIAPLFYGWAFDSLGVSSPYYFSSAIIAATILLGFGLDRYAKADAGQQPALAAPPSGSQVSVPATSDSSIAKAATGAARET